MLILDTDHFSDFLWGGAAASRLRHRLDASPLSASISIVTVEEQNRGWLATIAKARDRSARIAAYYRYQVLTDALKDWEVVAWSSDAEDRLGQVAALKLRIGTLDLRIAAISLSHGATLLSRNLRDFGRIPGLVVEDWTA